MSDVSRTPEQTLQADEVRRLCGDLLDWKLAAILELNPSAGDVAAAVAWAGGVDELGQQGRPLEGTAARVYDVLVCDEIFEDGGRGEAS